MNATGKVLLTLFTAGICICTSSHAQQSLIQTVLQQYPQRQLKLMETQANDSTAPTLVRAAALLFQGKQLDQANGWLSDVSLQGANPYPCTVALRILFAFSNQPDYLKLATRQHLETELAQWMRANPLQDALAPSSVDHSEIRAFTEASIALVWANHVQQATPSFQWPDRKSNASHLKRHTAEIHQWLENKIRYGFMERASPDTIYGLAPLFMLRDAVHAPSLQIKADCVIDIILADWAIETIEGHWGGARCSTPQATLSVPGPAFKHVLFGFPYQESRADPIPALTLHLGRTRYKPPGVLIRLARETAFRGIYETRHRFDPLSMTTLQRGAGRKYSYVTPSYILGSFPLNNERVPLRSRPWDLLIHDEQDREFHLFSFTGNELVSGGRESLEEDNYLWNASCFQYKNIVFSRYHRCDRIRPHLPRQSVFVDSRYVQWPTRIWIPNSFAPITQEQSWWFSQVGSVYLAFRPLRGRSYWWRTTEFAPTESHGVSILSFQDLFTAFLLEVETESNFTSFDQFKDQVIHSPLEIDNDSITFVSRRGDVFLFPLDDADVLVNGEVFDPWNDASYQLFHSPFIQSAYGSGILHADWQNYSLHIDITDPDHPRRIVRPE